MCRVGWFGTWDSGGGAGLEGMREELLGDGDDDEAMRDWSSIFVQIIGWMFHKTPHFDLLVNVIN